MVQHNRRWTADLAKRPAAPLAFGLPVSLALLTLLTGLSSGCSAGDRTLTTIGMPAAESTVTRGDALLGASRVGGPEPLSVSAHQREYLNALVAAGVRPSEDLAALSIGAYVCQARAAKQTEQAVWDYVLPLVRKDLHDTHHSSIDPEAGEVAHTTADYIRIATERLC